MVAKSGTARRAMEAARQTMRIEQHANPYGAALDNAEFYVAALAGGLMACTALMRQRAAEHRRQYDAWEA